MANLRSINDQYVSRYERVSGDLIPLRNRSKLVKENLFAITDLLLGAKFITLYFIWRVGDDFRKNLNLKKFFFLHLIFHAELTKKPLLRELQVLAE